MAKVLITTIPFGDKNHLSLEMLEELNIKTRTKYLARVTNPVDGAVPANGGGH